MPHFPDSQLSGNVLFVAETVSTEEFGIKFTGKADTLKGAISTIIDMAKTTDVKSDVKRFILFLKKILFSASTTKRIVIYYTIMG